MNETIILLLSRNGEYKKKYWLNKWKMMMCDKIHNCMDCPGWLGTAHRDLDGKYLDCGGMYAIE